jgi:hypothetical protein
MDIGIALTIARGLRLLSEEDAGWELPEGVSVGEDRADLPRSLARRTVAFALRILLIVAGVGGIHTLFGFCPDQGAWVDRSDYVNIIFAPPLVAYAISEQSAGENHWAGRGPLPMVWTLCDRCYWPLRIEFLSRARMEQVMSDWQVATGARFWAKHLARTSDERWELQPTEQTTGHDTDALDSTPSEDSEVRQRVLD